MTVEKPKKKQILVLLDSHAILHRAFHALPPSFVAPDGTPTNALYGFSSFLIRILKELKPDFIAAAYDLPEPTFRKVAYKEYKSQRKEMDPSLAAQINKSKEILATFKIPVFEFAGFEADDVLGTIVNNSDVKKNLKKNLKIIIASGDMDTLQLVENNEISVFTLKKGINDTTIYNEKQVLERFGFPPKLIPDYKGLCGDQSDNIKGVSGIGEKSAKGLIQKFGSLDDIYKILEKDEKKFESADIRKRVIELLKNQKEEAFFSRSLAEIRHDAPINFSLSEIQKSEKPRKEAIVKIFEELGFRSLTGRLSEVNYFLNDISAEVETILPLENQKKCKKRFEKQTEKNKEIFWIYEPALTAGRNEKNAQLKIIAVLKSGEIFEFNENDFIKEKEFFKKLLCEKENRGYKVKELYHYFEKLGFSPNFKFDIYIAAWVLNSELNNPSLNDIFRLCELSYFDHSSLNNIFKCENIILEMLKKEGLENVFFRIEAPLIEVLKDIEKTGILIDAKKLGKLSQKYDKEIKKIQQNIWKAAGEEFNINSTKELRRILFEKLNITTKGIRKTEGGLSSTKFSELSKMRGRHPIIAELILYRELVKLKSTYLDALPPLASKDGRLHTVFNQTGTVTGRLSSSNPNLQNIPVKGKFGNEIRGCFIAEKGFKLASFDYSQIELRVAAVLSSDKKMLKAFKDNEDIHSLTASEIFNVPLEQVTSDMRKKAKTINFGILYGMGVNSLKERLEITRQEAEIYRQEYFNDFKGIADFFANVIQEAKETGYVKTIFGRKRYIKNINAPQDFIRKEAERMAFNMPIQGSAADIIKMAMVKIHEESNKNKEFKTKVKTVLQIHDELLFEIKEDYVGEAEKIIKNIMESVYRNEIILKIDANVGDNWAFN